MSEQDKRAELKTQIYRLGTEYGNLSDRKLDQWLHMLDEAGIEPKSLEKAVTRLLRDPDRQYLPKIGELLACCPGSAPRNGFELAIQEGRTAIWSWLDGSFRGDLSTVPESKARREAALALRLWPPHRRHGDEWAQVKALILFFEPKAFDREAERAQRSLPMRNDPFADEVAA